MSLIDLAKEAAGNAYAPYSGYSVGCALRSGSGAIYAGANIENVSFGATICAERAAIAAMVTAGDREIREMALATRDGGFPCGICLQVILEFSPDPSKVVVTAVNAQGQAEARTLAELLPHAFRSSEVHRTE